MVDIAKRINKKSDQLQGEQVLVGTFCSPKGAFGKTLAFGAVGAVVGEALATRKAAKASAAEGEVIGSRVPPNPSLVGLTPSRLVFFGVGKMTGGATDLQGSISLAEVQSITANHGAAKSTMALTFQDGSSREFEAVRGGKPKDFVSALESALAHC